MSRDNSLAQRGPITPPSPTSPGTEPGGESNGGGGADVGRAHPEPKDPAEKAREEHERGAQERAANAEQKAQLEEEEGQSGERYYEKDYNNQKSQDDDTGKGNSGKGNSGKGSNAPTGPKPPSNLNDGGNSSSNSGRAGQRLPKYDQPNSYVRSANGKHIWVCDEDGKLQWDIDVSRAKAYEWNQNPRTGQQYISEGDKFDTPDSWFHLLRW